MKLYKKQNVRSKIRRTNLVVAFFVFLFFLISSFPVKLNAAAGVPLIINFQGRLLNSSGDLLGGPSGTNYCYKFSIYDAASGGSKIWPTGSPSTMTILTREGVFDAPVGDTGAGGDVLNLSFNDDQAFMDVQVSSIGAGSCTSGDESFDTLTPRQQIVSSAFAINSKTVGGFTPAQSATGSQIPVLTSGSLVLGDTNPGLKVTGTNTLTFQSGVTGDIQFYSSSNKINSSGVLTIASNILVGAGSGIDVSSSGVLNLGNVNATSLSICNSVNCDILNIGTNVDADDINIGDSLDTLTITGNSSSLFALNGVNISASEFNVLDSGIELGDLTTQGSATDEYCLTSETGGGELLAWQACGGSGGLTVGTTAVASGGANRILFENGSNVLSETADFTYDGTTLGVITSSTIASNKSLNISQTGATSGTDYAGYFSNIGAATTNVGLYTTASGGTTNLGLNVDAGQVLIGGTTLSTGTLAKLNIISTNSSNGSTTAIAGIHGDYTFNNGGSSSFVQVGNRFVFNNTPTTNSNTMVGEIIRTIDNTTLANLVRGIEVTSSAGSNTSGTNTGIRTTGATFGIQAITTGLAGGVSAPAAIYGENTGTTQGDILRLYSNTITSSPQMAYFYQDTSTFTGTGLLMDFATGSGTFSGNFIDLQNNNTSVFKVTSAGITSLGLGSTASTNAVCSSLANTTSPTSGVAYELRDCNASPAADYAEMYPVEEGIGFADIVAVGTEMVTTYDVTDGNIDWTKVKGNITKLVKSNGAYQNNVIGIVSDNYGDFSSTGHNIKEEDNSMPVALNGRVPVKISKDSFPVKAGDYLTTSNEAGKAMKATKAGFVIGKALESWSPSEFKSEIMVYVEQGYYNGESIQDFAGLTQEKNSDVKINLQGSKILSLFLQNQEEGIIKLPISEIITDRIASSLEIITPQLTTSYIDTDKVLVNGEAQFAGLTLFTNDVSLLKGVKFSSQPEFLVPPLFNSDTAGFALIKKGDREVRIEFTDPYITTPVVTTSITFEKVDVLDKVFFAEKFFAQNISFLVLEKDQTGFTILLNKEAEDDIKFSWIALAVKDPKTFESIISGIKIDLDSNLDLEESTNLSLSQEEDLNSKIVNSESEPLVNDTPVSDLTEEIPITDLIIQDDTLVQEETI